VQCSRHREVLSAALDGEASASEERLAEAHVAACAACRAWREAAVGVTRAARLVPAEPVPDLAEAVLLAAPAASPVRAARGDGSSALRAGLVLVAVAQVVVATSDLAAGEAAHAVREQAAWELALAAGFGWAAWRPERAGGLLPVLATLVVALVGFTGVDVAEGVTTAAAEGHHLLPLVGLAILAVRHRVPVRA
jgi:predicted anti-sigma-YlaC factor YlaD